MIVWNNHPQGSDEWLDARRGAITGSMSKMARDKLKNGKYSAQAMAYAMDTARERLGGRAPQVFQNAAMREGIEQEPHARLQYEATTGAIVQEVGFAHTSDRRFGCSVDGLVGEHGIWECKTMVSSNTLFCAMVDGDISAYRDQCLFAMWLLCRRWVDLSLWCADLQAMVTVRIERDDDEIEEFEADLMAFDALATEYAGKLEKIVFTPADELMAA